MVTKSPRKQRRRMMTLALHMRGKQIASHFSDDLLKKYKRRAFPLRVGDTVKVIRGDSAGHTGKVLAIDRDTYTVEIDGVTVRKARGTEMARPMHPSNLVITKLNLSDPQRRQRLAAKGVKVEAPSEDEEVAPAKPVPSTPEEAAPAKPAPAGGEPE